MIRWRKKDYNNLNSVVRKFNNKIKRLEKLGYDFLPKKLDYADIKSRIFNRSEFNRVISSYSSFLKTGAENIVKINESEFITKWERNFINKQQRVATSYLEKQIDMIPRTFGTGTARKNELESTLETVKSWKSKSGIEFSRIKERIINLGNTDIEYYHASVFQKNFIKAYSKMKRWEIVKEARKYNNPMEFWEFIKNSELTDIQLRYDVEKNVISLNMDSDDSYFYELFKLGLL